jgi:sucrose-6-phosphate hydrolase SacC (GH32 family)
MKTHRIFSAVSLLVVYASLCSAQTTAPVAKTSTVPTPIFTDPNYECAADPEVIWNRQAKEWWIFYTARRITADQNPGCGGTPIGVCASADLIHWRFVGYCKFDGIGGDKDGPTTLWAPGIITDDAGNYHLYVTYKAGAPGPWGEGKSSIRHYISGSDDLLNGWKKVSDVTPFADVIDPGLFRDGNRWMMVYRAIPPKASPPGTVYWATSSNGNDWTFNGQLPGEVNDKSINGAGYQEAPYLFRWKNDYWLLTDQGNRLGQYRSSDLKTWTFTGSLLANPGWRDVDKNSGKHPSVAVIGNRAFIFYFNHPFHAADKSEQEKKRAGRSLLHLSELTLKDDRLDCDRNVPVVPPANVEPASPNAGR